MHRRAVVFAAMLAFSPPSGTAADSSELAHLASYISPEYLMKAVEDLSLYEGRQSGTPGGDAAAGYIAGRLPEAIRQWFPVNTVQTDTPIHAAIQIAEHSTPLRIGRDFLPIVSAAPAEATSVPVVFVGYGIEAPQLGLDEYAGLSVSGKVVLFLRGQPNGFTGRIAHGDKVGTARARGAVAYLTVTGPILSPYEQRRGMGEKPLILYEGTRPETLPGLWLDPAVAEAILAPTGQTLRSFQEHMNQSRTARSSDTGARLTIAMRRRPFDAQASNVIARWSGSDPELGKETVVIGAHYDHFGTQGGVVFPGADDNASGTAVLLEVARVLSAAEARPKRSLVFISFAGEEQGLLGSRFYVSSPAFPLKAVKAMVNVDHAGVGNGKITVGLSTIEKAVARAAAEQAGLGGRLELFGLFPGGDHVPFAEAGVPTAALVTSGPHPDFHRPTDQPDKINAALLADVTRYVLALVWTLANAP